MAGIKTPIKSIREYCIGCSGGYKGEVRLCPIVNCPLYPYRMGHRPKNVENTDSFSEEILECQTILEDI